MLATPQIQAIDRATVHNICSGQVIVSLATAAKELVENSLDADARSVNITFRDHGLKSIEVADDGAGIEQENFASLTLKHHTSKIRDFDDISDVSTFGFRGEALSSLCALGNLSVLTSTGGPGTLIQYDGNGRIVSTASQARPQGTTVSISNLFQSLPVRHKEFSKNVKKEFHKAVEALQAYAMIASTARMHCVNVVNKRKLVLFSTSGESSFKENVINVLGITIFKNLTSFQFTDSVYSVQGYISKPLPKHGRGSADKQYIFINGRPCDHDKLSKQVNSTFRKYEKFQFPVCVIVISLSKGCVDVNVTPDKRKLFLDNEDQLIQSLSEHLDVIFEKFAGVYIDQGTQSKLKIASPFTDIPGMYQSEQKVSDSSQLINQIKPNTNSTSLSSQPSVQENNFSEMIIEIMEPPLFADPQHQPQTDHTLKFENDSEHFSMTLIEPANMQCHESSHPDDLTPPQSSVYEHTEQVEFDVSEGDPVFSMSVIEPSRCKSTSSVELVDQTETHPTSLSPSNSSCPPKSHSKEESLAVQDFDSPSVSRKRRCVPFKFTKPPMECNPGNIDDKADDDIYFKHQIVTNEAAESELCQKITKEMFRKMEVLGQFNLGFILVKLNSNLFIIDQHATDEKYRYEKLRKETVIESQKLICPKTMSLNGAHEDLMLSYRDIFLKNGFQFTYEDTKPPGSRVALTSLPRSKYLMFEESDVEELLWLLSEDTQINRSELRPSKVHRMFASRSCRAAVMIGTALTISQMREIVGHMADMDHPWNCPHGRPTMRHVVDLARIS